ncbi:MAG: hypothetical protein Q9209_003007 [Squamulea sp. 1 TL-2023]
MTYGDLAPQFSIVYPEILERWVPEQDFRDLVTGVNARLASAFRPEGWRAWKDALLGVCTGWVWEDLGGEGVHVKKMVRECERWVEGWNEKRRREGGGEGMGEEEGLVRVVGLRRTGFLCVSLLFYIFWDRNGGRDPQVRIADTEEEERQTTAPSRRASL